MGLEISKQFIDLNGEPVIARTLNAFEKSSVIDSVVVVCRDCDRKRIEDIVLQKNFKKIKSVAPGGLTRDESVCNGILKCDERTTHFAIHDGARPFIRAEFVRELISQIESENCEAAAIAVENGSAVLATFVTDTIKVVNENDEIVSTPVRSTLRAVQTPQVFEKNIYLKALEYAKKNKDPVTDDCKLVENIGEKIKIVIGSETNIKLTTKNDIKLAKSILKEERL